MNPKNDLTQSGQPRPTPSPAPRPRFRIEKLEERIAPKSVGRGTRHKGSFCCGGTRAGLSE